MACPAAFGQDVQDYRVYSIILEDFLRDLGTEKRFIIVDQDSDTVFVEGDTKAPKLTSALDSLMKTKIKFDNKFQIKGWESVVITHQEFKSLTIDENGDWIDDAL